MIAKQKQPLFVVIFAVAYAVIYALAVQFNWALFTYHPALGTFGLLTTPAKGGPTMFWYGWMATAALGALVLAFLASLLPERAGRRIWPGFAWLVPVCAMVFMAFLLKGFFLR